VPLFIDRLPFHRWTDPTRTPPKDYWSVVLPLAITERGLPGPSAAAVVQHWRLDTGNTGEAFAWRHHLLTAGLDPDVQRAGGLMRVQTAIGREVLVPIREADLWLLSNLPAQANTPCLLKLDRGIAFRDVPSLPDPYFHRPLLGLQALRRAGLRLELDLAQDTISVWTPPPPGPPP
jgi:hypothetical protein